CVDKTAEPAVIALQDLLSVKQSFGGEDRSVVGGSYNHLHRRSHSCMVLRGTYGHRGRNAAHRAKRRRSRGEEKIEIGVEAIVYIFTLRLGFPAWGAGREAIGPWRQRHLIAAPGVRHRG